MARRVDEILNRARASSLSSEHESNEKYRKLNENVIESEELSTNLMARNSRERRSCVHETHNQFSDLPESIIHHIFSFLDANDVVRCSTLSKRFEQLCISSPYLTFKGISDTKGGRCTRNCKAFSKSVYNYLRLRDGAKIDHLDLQWTCNEGKLKEAILNTWIHDAVRCQVEVFHLRLDLNLITKKAYVLPRCILECPSLRDFELTLSNSDYRGRGRVSSLKLPSVDFASLQVLSLGCFRLEDDDIGDWISAHCKTVRKLRLYGMERLHELRITSSSLEDLSIRFCFKGLKGLTISAPKLHTLSIETGSFVGQDQIVVMDIVAQDLQNFHWSGKIVGKFLKNFMEAQTATFNHIDSFVSIGDYGTGLLHKTLQAVSQCKVLHLHIHALDGLFIEDQLPIFFGDVVEFVLEAESLDDYQVPVLCTFLKGLPKLTILQIKCKTDLTIHRPRLMRLKDSLMSKECYREVEESPERLFKNLKVVEIQIDNGIQQTGFIEYLLQHAKGLEKMSVVYLNSFSGKLSSMGFNLSYGTGAVQYCIDKKFGRA